MALPTTKSKIKTDFLTTKTCIVGDVKSGKSTFASQLGDKVLFLATEAGLDFLEVFKVDIKSYKDFSNAVTELTAKKADFTTIVIDVVDKLVEMAEAEICSRNKVPFIKDMPYGAGYTATKRLILGDLEKLAMAGYGISLITHTKMREVKTELISWTAMATSLGKSYEESLLGFCDFILFVHINAAGKRMLRTKPNKYILCAGDRSTKLPETMELDAKKVIEIISMPGSLVAPIIEQNIKQDPTKPIVNYAPQTNQQTEQRKIQ